uniref:Transmembrane protein n=1 Tax=Medicago truncatula TaxID=3880 RepID=I3S035_MEDTR|nr:unknown [Medicago truncatula]
MLGLGLSNRLVSSLSFRLLLVVLVLGVNTRRGGKRIVLVFTALYPHATSLPTHAKNNIILFQNK